MLWEKMMLGQILNRPSRETIIVSKPHTSDVPGDSKARPIVVPTEEGASPAIFERVRDRFSR